jgi:hypothetical protein
MEILLFYDRSTWGQDSSVGIATGDGLDSPIQGLNPGGGEIFCTHPDWPWGPPSLLHNGYWVFTGVMWLGRGADHPPPSRAKVMNE